MKSPFFDHARMAHSPSATAIAGDGGPPCEAGCVRGGAGLERNASVHRFARAYEPVLQRAKKRRADAPASTTVRSLRELQSDPARPLSRGRNAIALFAPSPFQFTARKTRKLRRRSADRRRGYCPSHANECCHSPALRARRALKRSALVCRRSAAALAGANERHRSTPARASWDPASSGVTRIWPVHSVQRVASQYRS